MVSTALKPIPEMEAFVVMLTSPALMSGWIAFENSRAVTCLPVRFASLMAVAAATAASDHWQLTRSNGSRFWMKASMAARAPSLVQPGIAWLYTTLYLGCLASSALKPSERCRCGPVPGLPSMRTMLAGRSPRSLAAIWPIMWP